MRKNHTLAALSLLLGTSLLAGAAFADPHERDRLGAAQGQAEQKRADQRHAGEKHMGEKRMGEKRMGEMHEGQKHEGQKHEGQKHEGQKHEGKKHMERERAEHGRGTHGRADRLPAAGDLDAARVVAAAERAGWRSVTAVEWERGAWKLRALDAEGRQARLRVDAQSGEIVETRR